MNKRYVTVPAALLLLAAPWHGRAQEPGEPGPLPPLLPEAEEVALAESAAPGHIARDAAVYVLKRGGYALVRASKNGFTCMVERSHPASLEPICFDAEGTRTIVPRVLEIAAWRESGMDTAAVAAAVADGFRQGRFRAPGRPGVAYMLSPATRYHDPATGRAEPGPPHLMFYAPYLHNHDIGSLGEHAVSGSHTPFVIEEGSPGAYIVVLVDRPDPAATSREGRE